MRFSLTFAGTKIPGRVRDRSLSVTEQVIGLGNYGKTLTVLTALDIEEQLEEIEGNEALVESWTPRFRR